METRWTGLEGLEVYQRARQFRNAIYDLSRKLPADERFVLVPQMRRAGLSLSNNIAEGYGRFHFKESMHFLRTARGSLEELRDDLSVCRDQGYVETVILEGLYEQTDVIRRLINGYIRYLSSQAHSESKVNQKD